MKKILIIIYLLIFNTINSQVHEEFHDNGKLFFSVNYNNGKREGIFNEYHENGELSSIGNYRNGTENGVWKYYNDNGKLDRIGKYKNGKRVENWKDYRETGELYSVGEYIGDSYSYKKTKKWTYYYRNGNIEKTGLYNNNNEIGEWKHYHENGQLKYFGNWTEGSVWKYYHSNGIFEGESEYIDRHFIQKGKWYHDNGKIAKKNYDKNAYKVYDKKGQLLENKKSNGAYKEYFSNGNLKESGYYTKNKHHHNIKNGEWKYYYENGKLQKFGNYLNDIKNGAWVYFYKNGKTHKKGNYKNDLRDGKWDFFNKNGKIQLNNNKPIIINKSNKITSFIPENWKIIQQIEGDLNNNSLKDVILIIENTALENFLENDFMGAPILNLNERYLLVLFKNKDLSYNLISLNKTFIHSENDIESICLADPLESIEIIDNNIKIKFNYWSSCGSYSTSNEEYIFNYDDNKFQLIKYNSYSFMRNSGEENSFSINYLNKTEVRTNGGNMFYDYNDKPITTTKKIEVSKRYNLQNFNIESYHSDF
ncbi:hypothetical protein F7644_06675 [Tenacibaculum finnmarkense genomovar ulcerans]|uniref:toxin-antitoxin system YwqK family antitoxin n=1 Tax=Tenacibaculum finnmarkense TaxID=2781243 RepID=UPI00187B66E1|nr:hypothetical protein [Tenacibaculum finnmarkense]MBE7645675.1 hypothetical protein [Tenacibaculum finnmarkense genomovar ulcerans]